MRLLAVLRDTSLNTHTRLCRLPTQCYKPYYKDGSTPKMSKASKGEGQKYLILPKRDIPQILKQAVNLPCYSEIKGLANTFLTAILKQVLGLSCFLSFFLSPFLLFCLYFIISVFLTFLLSFFSTSFFTYLYLLTIK